MPIRQPAQTTIPASDFRDKAYCFAVESVIMPQERSGLLTISASLGYLLTTSINKELKREQTFKHVQQPDGSWVIAGTVTVVSTGDSMVDGAIIIQNSLNEILVLTIEATANSLVQLPKPVLTVNHSTLAFQQTLPDKPSFLVLTIGQVGDTPVTLTTDAPDYFQLASNNRPAFLPTLTLTPSPLGSYVHIRYSASKKGYHSGTLTVQNQYEKRAVTLEGRSAGFLPAFRQTILRQPNRPVIAKPLVKLLSLVVVGGLAYAGYINRCELFPTLCQEPAISQFSIQANKSLPALSHVSRVSAKAAIRSTVVTKRATGMENTTLLSKSADQPPVPLSAPAAKQITSDKLVQESTQEASELADQKKTIKPENNNQPDRQNLQRPAPGTSTGESELEQVLNQKP